MDAQVNKTRFVMEYIQIIAGAALVALSFNIFLLPSKLAAGGLAGVSTLLFELYQWNPALVQFGLNIPLLIIGFLLLGKDFGAKTIVGTIAVPFFIWVTQHIHLNIQEPMLGAIYGGMVVGTGLGLIYRGGGSTGGTALLGQVVKKYTGFSSGFSLLIVDGMVVTASAFVFNLELALFAMIAIYVTSKMVDFVQLQVSQAKLLLIITENEEKVQKIISEEVDRGLTKVQSLGGYSNSEKMMILTVVEQSEAVYLKKVLQEREPSSFVIFLNASEILGRGFSKAKKETS